MNLHLAEFLLYMLFLLIVIIASIIADVIDKKHEKKMGSDCFVVRQSTFYLWKWTALTAAFILFLALMRFSQERGNDTVHWSMYLTCLVFLIFSIGMVVDYFRWKVIVHCKSVSHRSLFKTQIFTLDEVEKVEVYGRQNCNILGSGGVKLLSVHQSNRGYEKLLDCFEEEGISIVVMNAKND
ncbi:MAG: hypothetical protein FWE25_06960 [Lachnospiraceae bacterium]|nr:hypothetical protein [Lachnospiraceae bacterium]